MSRQTSLRRLLSILVPISITSTIYLYLYPILHGCNFPPIASNPSNATFPPAVLNTLRQHVSIPYLHTSNYTHTAPFRLLVLADPQLEGDTSLPKRNDTLSKRLAGYREAITTADSWAGVLSATLGSLRDTLLVDIPRTLFAARKRIDLFGNDYYLAHIYRSLHWWSKPTHVTVLGDLIGSQWVTDGEFEWRAWRYWNRVFGGGVRVDDEITVTGSEGVHGTDVKVEEDLLDGQGDASARSVGSWENRIINVAGNHDVGYAGDISDARIERFDKAFGRANWDIRFQYHAVARDNNTTTSPEGTHSVITSTPAMDGASPSSIPSIHLIVLNSLVLDTPALYTSIQKHTYDFINDVIQRRSRPVEDRSTFTLLLTHLPLHKQIGVCTDAPHFRFYDKDDDRAPKDQEPRFKAGGLREQNHLSEHASQKGILQGLFGMSGDQDAPAGGMGRNGLVLTGHDHVGCDVMHFVNRSMIPLDDPEWDMLPGWSWAAKRYPSNRYSPSSPGPSLRDPDNTPRIREVTLRSMMGEYGGNAGFLSLWFDSDPSVGEWKYEISTCRFGVQHIWWGIHILGIATAILSVVSGVLSVWKWLFGAPASEAATGSKANRGKGGVHRKDEDWKKGTQRENFSTPKQRNEDSTDNSKGDVRDKMRTEK
ncbi:hypothetical protein AJ78_05248 [Emergomyces pasteurianus Ep9510]|uniref:Calcineurin-like phosphoesterase domain-containing protein n=1 Tax=Emergomyces pasteurianus Ep9510 TaxID=1447872 RepID=A0A1J9PD03_9EURO|nr:hypothetical protein AJ78_05248 [Emergomyces pasteurianus Ep9510]